MEENLQSHIEAFRADGFVIFRGVGSPGTVASWHDARDRLVSQLQFVSGSDRVPEAVSNLVERAPEVALPFVTHPILWKFAEYVMGPFVQLDTVVLAGTRASSADAKETVVHWHRERFGFLPRVQGYHRPQAVSVLCYMQDMTLKTGPLRVIPGSHARNIHVADHRQPHREELLVTVDRGDAVLFHQNLIHSATANVSGVERRFLGMIYNLSALRHEDNFDGPNCRLIIERARHAQDRRLLRLLGCDELIYSRYNNGFLRAEEVDWEMWRQEDERLAGGAEPVPDHAWELRVRGVHTDSTGTGDRDLPEAARPWI